MERLARSAVAFALSRAGGAMLIGGSLAMLSMSTVGGLVANYGWREAQQEEIDAAFRASVSASGHLMRGDLATVEDDIKERVAGFLRGLLGNITIDKDDVVVNHDFSTNRTVIRIEGSARFRFTNLWATGSAGGEKSLHGERVIVVFDASQFEFALALDLSSSMGFKPAGWTATRLDVLKDAIKSISQTIDAVSQTNPGIVALALVPYSNVVNVANTSGTSRTDAKERYVRMLTGAEYNTQTSRDTEGHWVDTFHNYGTGHDMGPLASRSLPDFLSAADWNLHQPGTEDVSSQAPTVDIWSFEGSDFWNGCVMARWGAYWDPAGRPSVWDPSDTDNWPARKTVAGWEPGSTSIAGLPLHLSDAPPHAGDPNTRFTAYSWPDARINGFADGFLSDVLQVTLDPSYDPKSTIRWYRGQGQHWLPTSDNHWHLRARDRGGSLNCPPGPIVPLTEDRNALQAVDNYDFSRYHSTTAWGQTFLHLGIVWGLRTLSPLWRDVWNTRTRSGHALPRKPCLDGGTTQGCSPFVEKTIVMVTDGGTSFGPIARGRHSGRFDPASPVTSNPTAWPGACHFYICRSYPWWGGCSSSRSHFNDYRTAMTAEDPATFAGMFDVGANGVFTQNGLDHVVKAFQALHPTVSTANQMVRNAHGMLWQDALKDMTPWQLFRGYDKSSPSRTVDATDVLTDPTNRFGFQGRPAQNGHFCRPSSVFSAYGRVDDLVRVGDGPPVGDVAPFSVPATWQASSTMRPLQARFRERLNDWLRQACDLAGQRGVRIEAIYIGHDSSPVDKATIARLEDCVDRSHGGNALKHEVFATPTAQELKDALEDIIDIRRTLRFVDQ